MAAYRLCPLCCDSCWARVHSGLPAEVSIIYLQSVMSKPWHRVNLVYVSSTLLLGFVIISGMASPSTLSYGQDVYTGWSHQLWEELSSSWAKPTRVSSLSTKPGALCRVMMEPGTWKSSGFYDELTVTTQWSKSITRKSIFWNHFPGQ